VQLTRNANTYTPHGAVGGADLACRVAVLAEKGPRDRVAGVDDILRVVQDGGCEHETRENQHSLV